VDGATVDIAVATVAPLEMILNIYMFSWLHNRWIYNKIRTWLKFLEHIKSRSHAAEGEACEFKKCGAQRRRATIQQSGGTTIHYYIDIRH